MYREPLTYEFLGLIITLQQLETYENDYHFTLRIPIDFACS